MAFLRRSWLIWLLLLLSGATGFAASREERAYGTAVLAFKGRFYYLAQSELTQYLESHGKSTNAPMAVLLLAESEYHLTNYAAAINQLGDPANLTRAQAAGLEDAYVYWRAEAQFAQGDRTGAAQTFVLVARNHPDSPLALSALVEAASVYAALGDREQVDELLGNLDGLFQRAAQVDPANARLQLVNGRLLAAESQCQQQHFAEALQVLDRLTPPLTLDQDWKRAWLLYRVHLRQNDWDAALAAATNLVQIASQGQGEGWATNWAESVACEAGVLEDLGRLDEASAAWLTVLTAAAPAGAQQHAALKLADLATRRGKNKEAESRLDDYLARYANTPAANAVLLALGELHLEDYVAQPDATSDLAQAQARLEQFRSRNATGPLAGKADLELGWCHWLAAQTAGTAGDTNAAAELAGSRAAFQAATAELPSASDDLAVAWFKAGDADFELTNYSGALTNYLAALAASGGLSATTNSLASRVLYQLVRTGLALNDARVMEDAMGQLVDKYFASAPADRGRLLAGQGFSDFDDPAKARAIFTQFARERTNSPLLPQAAFAAARTYAQETNWAAAITHYQAWLETYPATNGLRPQVEYARDWTVAQTGEETNAFQMFTNFVVEYTNELTTPLAFWWVAGHYFQQGDFVAAELNYKSIYQGFPTNELAYPAKLMAGRSAMARSAFAQAINSYLIPLVYDTNYPPDLQGLKTQALFAYCEALRDLNDTNSVYALNLQTATNVLGPLCAKNPTNEVGALAWGEIGDCDLQLGDLDAATNAYAQAQASPAASPALFYRATVGLGDTLKKKSEVDGLSDEDRKTLLNQAMNEYLKFIYGSSDEWWVKEAAWKALPLIGQADTGDADPNNLIDQLEQRFPQLKETLEKKRAALPK